MSDAWLLAGARTPIGRFLGELKDVPAPELAATTIRASLERAGLEPGAVQEVFLGNVVWAGVGQAPARQAALKAGIPPAVPATTVNMVCGSGLKAVMLASQSVRLGENSVVVAGGMENMSLAPHLVRNSREGFRLGNVTMDDAVVHDGLWCAADNCHMGIHAEWTAGEHGLTREDLDRYSARSQQLAAAAAAAGEFADEIVPVKVKAKKEQRIISVDEGPRPGTTAEGLARLRPVFDPEGMVTAGNASPLSDGAATVIVADDATAAASAAPWKARIVASYISGLEPRQLFVAPILAVRGVLEKAGLKQKDIDLFEINEAFASQMLACIQELNLDLERVNVCGGAIALGHPIGASGARVLVTLLSAMVRRDVQRGLATLCLGGGNAVAMIVERT
ncbi:MAG: acetyl-CoA C-acetyltransferase [Planctomycetaceae bacterium]|nr:acetyl-CoA C-acetyltransferase [Planctomycetaceae bacterium]